MEYSDIGNNRCQLQSKWRKYCQMTLRPLLWDMWYRLGEFESLAFLVLLAIP